MSLLLVMSPLLRRRLRDVVSLSSMVEASATSVATSHRRLLETSYNALFLKVFFKRPNGGPCRGQRHARDASIISMTTTAGSSKDASRRCAMPSPTVVAPTSSARSSFDDLDHRHADDAIVIVVVRDDRPRVDDIVAMSSSFDEDARETSSRTCRSQI